MNKYSEWTDDQINIEVHKRYKNECFYNDGKQVARVDYCNDWGNAGPLTQEMGIIINWHGHYARGKTDVQGLLLSFYERNDGALRAAMEVYLMMTEGE